MITTRSMKKKMHEVENKSNANDANITNNHHQSKR